MLAPGLTLRNWYIWKRMFKPVWHSPTHLPERSSLKQGETQQSPDHLHSDMSL